MKWLIALALILAPASVWANCSSQQTEKVIVKKVMPDGRELVDTDIVTVCKDETRDRFSRCRTQQWDTFHGGVNTKKLCSEWNEQDATLTALTYAEDNVTVEWLDTRGKFRGSIRPYTIPKSQEGWCREITVKKDYGSSADISVRTMCYSEGRGWQYWRR